MRYRLVHRPAQRRRRAFASLSLKDTAGIAGIYRLAAMTFLSR